jgi:tetratricopeptide (TPR) repeat protein
LKYILTLALFISSNFVFSQNIAEKLYPDVCDCFSKEAEQKNFNTDLLTKCFDFSKREKEIESYLKNSTDSTNINKKPNSYVQGYKMGQKMFDDLQIPLINKCDSYYTYLTEIQKVLIKSLEKSTTENDIKSLNKAIRKKSASSENYYEKGLYELGKKKNKKAIKSLRKSIELDSTNMKVIFFLSIAYEMENKYDLAIDNYEKFIEQKENKMTFIAKVFLNLTKRKLKDKK